jgi:hypothetical protein
VVAVCGAGGLAEAVYRGGCGGVDAVFGELSGLCAIAEADLARVDAAFLAATGREFKILESSEYVSLADVGG